MQNRILVALDFAKKDETIHFLKQFNNHKPAIKVGMELFYQEGPDLIRLLKSEGYEIFLDLKLHDIPTTVYKAMKGLAQLDVDMVNVHAAGGKKMMEAAITGLEEGTLLGGERPLCIAVTQLTSTDQTMLEKELLITQDLNQVIVKYSELASESGCDGVVCSAWEAQAIKEAVSRSFLTVTPGIRLAGDAHHDQKRVATPGKARSLGSDFIVVGRSITGAHNPEAAYLQVEKEWSEGHVG